MGFPRLLVLTANREQVKLLLLINRRCMERQKNGVLPGALNLMALALITGADKKRLAAEEGAWRRISEIMTRTLEPSGGSL
jgi:hypothetical protein